MELAIEFVKILLPAGLVLYAMFLTTKSFLNKEMNQRMVDIKLKNTETILPIRLQAYERISLLLERISPNNLVRRLNDSSYSAKEFQQILLNEIREEYNHNVSQQVYITEEGWNLVCNAVEEVIMTINQAADSLSEEAKSIDLAKKIFELRAQKNYDPIGSALSRIKNEIRQFF